MIVQPPTRFSVSLLFLSLIPFHSKHVKLTVKMIDLISGCIPTYSNRCCFVSIQSYRRRRSIARKGKRTPPIHHRIEIDFVVGLPAFYFII